LKVEKIESYKANCWLMSPPCQPYTRGLTRNFIFKLLLKKMDIKLL